MTIEIKELEADLDNSTTLNPDRSFTTERSVIKAAQAHLKYLQHTKPLIDELLEAVKEQAEDEGLWFHAHTAPEAYVQNELRNLHELIEETSGDEIAANIVQKLIDRGG